MGKRTYTGGHSRIFISGSGTVWEVPDLPAQQPDDLRRDRDKNDLPCLLIPRCPPILLIPSSTALRSASPVTFVGRSTPRSLRCEAVDRMTSWVSVRSARAV
jgi:hypothetical protein